MNDNTIANWTSTEGLMDFEAAKQAADKFQALPPPVRSILLRDKTHEALKKALTEAKDDSVVAIRGTIVDLAAIKIYVEDDPIARKARAFMEAMEGRSCIYEDEDGNLCQFRPKAGPDLLSPINRPTMKPTPPQPTQGTGSRHGGSVAGSPPQPSADDKSGGSQTERSRVDFLTPYALVGPAASSNTRP